MTKPSYTLTFQSEKDFVRAASAFLGAAYVSGSDAVNAINRMPLSRSFGQIEAMLHSKELTPGEARVAIKGNKVSWTSQAGGFSKTKEGEIVHVVPKGGLPPRGFITGCGSPRKEESYVVKVGNAYYWPRVSALKILWTENTMTLFEKIGITTVARIDELQRKKEILAVHHQPNGTSLVLKDASKLLLEGLTEDDSRRVVGYLGFYGHGELGLDTPAFLYKPEGYPDRDTV